MNYNRYFSLIVCLLLLVSCNKVNKLEKKENYVMPESSSILRNHDDLAFVADLIKRYTDGNKISEEKRKSMLADERNKDHLHVIMQIAETDLLTEVESVKTISWSYYSRGFLVTMKNGQVYYIELSQHHDHEGIWTLTSYYHVTSTDEYDLTNYEEITIEETPEEVRGQLDKLLVFDEWRHDIVIYEGKTYVFIKSPSEKDALEVERFYFSEGSGSVDVFYHRYENIDSSRYGVKNYALFVINESVKDVFYHYSLHYTVGTDCFFPRTSLPTKDCP